MTDIGSTLREARLKQGIDISDVESETKIRAKFLRALENEEWALVGNDTYVRVFIRTYAECLGIDSTPLLEAYVIDGSSPSIVARSQSAARAERRQRTHRIRNGLIGVGLIVVLIIAVMVIGSGGTN